MQGMAITVRSMKTVSKKWSMGSGRSQIGLKKSEWGVTLQTKILFRVFSLFYQSCMVAAAPPTTSRFTQQPSYRAREPCGGSFFPPLVGGRAFSLSATVTLIFLIFPSLLRIILSLFIYFLGRTGSQLWCTGSLLPRGRSLVAAGRIQFCDQGSKLGSLHCDHRALPTEPAGKFQE